MLLLTLVVRRVTEHAKCLGVANAHEVVQDFLVVAQLHLSVRVLVSELDAGLIVVNLEDLDVDLHLFAFGIFVLLSCCLIFCCSCACAANSVIELHT